MEKLVAMYNTGDGVARDYRQAIVWRRRLADALRVRWEAVPTEDAFKALADALWELGDQYSDLADLAAASVPAGRGAGHRLRPAVSGQRL